MSGDKLIHDDFIKATDFLGTTYRAYEQLIIADPSNRLDHMTNWDKALGKVRNCFKHIETCVVSDNYFRSVTGLPPAPYPKSQPIQSALEWTSTWRFDVTCTTWSRLCQQATGSTWDLSWWDCHVKHIKTAYTQRIHHPCDHGYSFLSHQGRCHPLWQEHRQCRYWICYTNHWVQVDPSLDQPPWE